MLTLCFILMCALLPFRLAAQPIYDAEWVFGYGYAPAEGLGLSRLAFRDQAVRVSVWDEPGGFILGGGGSFVGDAAGVLQLVSNNCRVMDAASLEVVDIGGALAPGALHESNCAPYGSYPCFQCNLLAPELTNDSVYYLLNNDLVLLFGMEGAYSEALYLNVLVKRADGSFYLKDRQTLRQGAMLPGRLTAGPHANGQQWWVWAVDDMSNRFYVYAIGGPDSLYAASAAQETGAPLSIQEADLGQATFSPDMQMLAINSRYLGVLLYDFDAGSGQLSNFRTVAYPGMERPRGLAFSPNSRWLYATAADRVCQIDLHAPDPTLAVEELARITLTDPVSGDQLGAGYMLAGPDCRIYISPGARAPYLHVIHQPNEAGAACGLELAAVHTPGRLDFFLPNQPMYRAISGCDSSLVWDIPVAISTPPANAALRVWPNPSGGALQVSLPEDGRPCVWELYDAAGRRVWKALLTTDGLRISGLTTGWYYWRAPELGAAGKVNVAR